MGFRGRGSKPSIIDLFTLADIRAGKQVNDRIREFHWRYYSELAFQRSENLVKLRQALLGAAIENWEFKNWQRVVKYRWALKPLSVAGSLVSPGGRFNIGDIDRRNFPSFPALYAAQDKATALAEVLGQDPEAKGKLTSHELALTNPTSIVSVSLSGRLQTAIDLTQPERLRPFLELIRDFKLSGETRAMARDLGKVGLHLPAKLVVTTMKELVWALLLPNWRELPVQLGIPSTTQIFGQLVADAGIEGILYPSKVNEGMCAAIFPQAFAGTESFVALDETAPRKDVSTRLDRHTWRDLAR